MVDFFTYAASRNLRVTTRDSSGRVTRVESGKAALRRERSRRRRIKQEKESFQKERESELKKKLIRSKLDEGAVNVLKAQAKAKGLDPSKITVRKVPVRTATGSEMRALPVLESSRRFESGKRIVQQKGYYKVNPVSKRLEFTRTLQVEADVSKLTKGFQKKAPKRVEIAKTVASITQPEKFAKGKVKQTVASQKAQIIREGSTKRFERAKNTVEAAIEKSGLEGKTFATGTAKKVLTNLALIPTSAVFLGERIAAFTISASSSKSAARLELLGLQNGIRQFFSVQTLKSFDPRTQQGLANLITLAILLKRPNFKKGTSGVKVAKTSLLSKVASKLKKTGAKIVKESKVPLKLTARQIKRIKAVEKAIKLDKAFGQLPKVAKNKILFQISRIRKGNAKLLIKDIKNQISRLKESRFKKRVISQARKSQLKAERLAKKTAKAKARDLKIIEQRAKRFKKIQEKASKYPTIQEKIEIVALKELNKSIRLKKLKANVKNQIITQLKKLNKVDDVKKAINSIQLKVNNLIKSGKKITVKNLLNEIKGIIQNIKKKRFIKKDIKKVKKIEKGLRKEKARVSKRKSKELKEAEKIAKRFKKIQEKASRYPTIQEKIEIVALKKLYRSQQFKNLPLTIKNKFINQISNLKNSKAIKNLKNKIQNEIKKVKKTIERKKTRKVFKARDRQQRRIKAVEKVIEFDKKIAEQLNRYAIKYSKPITVKIKAFKDWFRTLKVKPSDVNLSITESQLKALQRLKITTRLQRRKTMGLLKRVNNKSEYAKIPVDKTVTVNSVRSYINFLKGNRDKFDFIVVEETKDFARILINGKNVLVKLTTKKKPLLKVARKEAAAGVRQTTLKKGTKPKVETYIINGQEVQIFKTGKAISESQTKSILSKVLGKSKDVTKKAKKKVPSKTIKHSGGDGQIQIVKLKPAKVKVAKQILKQRQAVKQSIRTATKQISRTGQKTLSQLTALPKMAVLLRAEQKQKKKLKGLTLQSAVQKAKVKLIQSQIQILKQLSKVLTDQTYSFAALSKSAQIVNSVSAQDVAQAVESKVLQQVQQLLKQVQKNQKKPLLKFKLPDWNDKLPKGYVRVVNVIVRSKGKVVEVPLKTTPNRALKKVSSLVDNSTERSFQLKIVGIRKAKDIKAPKLTKFRSKKSKGSKVLKVVEKTKYAIDTKGEKKKLSISKLLKKRK